MTREELPDGRILVRLADNITEGTDNEGGTAYQYDEVTFDLPQGRTDSAAQIEADFAAWWAYGSQDQAVPSLAERVAALEDAMLGLLM